MTEKRYDLGDDEQGRTLVAWGENDLWRVSVGRYCEAYVVTEVSRKRHEDYTGRKKFRIVTQRRAHVSLRINPKGAQLHIDTPFLFTGGEKAMIREIAESVASGHMWKLAEFDAEVLCRKAGVPEGRILDAMFRARGRHAIPADLAIELYNLATDTEV